MSRVLFIFAVSFSLVDLAGQSHALTSEQDLAMQKIRTHCQSCHGVGELRFIHSESNADLWWDIHHLESPQSQQVWRSLILKVLSWPTNSPPAFGELMEPPDRDWMPKGAKRLKIVRDKIGNQDARQFILSILSQ